MQKTQILENIRATRIIPVVRTKSKEEAKGVIEAILAGGINVLEITMTTPNAVGLIADCVKKYDEKVIVGAGTVVDPETAKTMF